MLRAKASNVCWVNNPVLRIFDTHPMVCRENASLFALELLRVMKACHVRALLDSSSEFPVCIEIRTAFSQSDKDEAKGANEQYSAVVRELITSCVKPEVERSIYPAFFEGVTWLENSDRKDDEWKCDSHRKLKEITTAASAQFASSALGEERTTLWLSAMDRIRLIACVVHERPMGDKSPFGTGLPVLVAEMLAAVSNQFIEPPLSADYDDRAMSLGGIWSGLLHRDSHTTVSARILESGNLRPQSATAAFFALVCYELRNHNVEAVYWEGMLQSAMEYMKALASVPVKEMKRSQEYKMTRPQLLLPCTGDHLVGALTTLHRRCDMAASRLLETIAALLCTFRGERTNSPESAIAKAIRRGIVHQATPTVFEAKDRLAWRQVQTVQLTPWDAEQLLVQTGHVDALASVRKTHKELKKIEQEIKSQIDAESESKAAQSIARLSLPMSMDTSSDEQKEAIHEDQLRFAMERQQALAEAKQPSLIHVQLLGIHAERCVYSLGQVIPRSKMTLSSFIDEQHGYCTLVSTPQNYWNAYQAFSSLKYYTPSAEAATTHKQQGREVVAMPSAPAIFQLLTSQHDVEVAVAVSIIAGWNGIEILPNRLQSLRNNKFRHLIQQLHMILAEITHWPSHVEAARALILTFAQERTSVYDQVSKDVSNRDLDSLNIHLALKTVSDKYPVKPQEPIQYVYNGAPSQRSLARPRARLNKCETTGVCNLKPGAGLGLYQFLCEMELRHSLGVTNSQQVTDAISGAAPLMSTTKLGLYEMHVCTSTHDHPLALCKPEMKLVFADSHTFIQRTDFGTVLDTSDMYRYFEHNNEAGFFSTPGLLDGYNNLLKVPQRIKTNARTATDDSRTTKRAAPMKVLSQATLDQADDF